MNADGIVDVSGYYAYPAPTWTLTLRDEADRLSTDYTVTSSTITRTKNYFHFGNLLVSTRDAGGAYAYYHSDHLGTPRLVTGAVSESHNYHPFGQEITPFFGNQPLKFASMERDASSGNDSNHARVCGTSTQGRFLSPDSVGGKSEDPQTWNRYTYALNNPLRYIDPDGEAPLELGDIAKAVKDSFVGYGKEAANTVIGLANTVNRPVDAALSPFTDFRFGQITEFESANKVQGNAMLGMAVVGMLATGGESAEVKLFSSIGKDKGLVRLAQEAGASVQKGIDTISSQLARGNLNPGIGTKRLFGDISYARARDGARVFFRQVGDKIEILAKASKKNEA